MAKLVRDIMKIGVPTCKVETPLPEVARIMARENADAVIVMDESGAVGVVSQTDLAGVYARNYALLTAQEIMADKIVSIPPDAAATAAAQIMQDEKVYQVFVMHDHPGPSRPSAVVTMRAVVRDMAGLETEQLKVPKKVPGKPAAKKLSRK
jgi:CBS domain-containing protein